MRQGIDDGVEQPLAFPQFPLRLHRLGHVFRDDHQGIDPGLRDAQGQLAQVKDVLRAVRGVDTPVPGLEGLTGLEHVRIGALDLLRRGGVHALIGGGGFPQEVALLAAVERSHGAVDDQVGAVGALDRHVLRNGVQHGQQQVLVFAQSLLGLDAVRDVAARAPVALEGAVLREDRLTAGAEPAGFHALAAAQVDEIPEGPALLQGSQVVVPQLAVVVLAQQVAAGLAVVPFGFDAEDALHIGGKIREAQLRIHLPQPVRRRLGEVAEAVLRGAQGGLGAFALGDVDARRLVGPHTLPVHHAHEQLHPHRRPVAVQEARLVDGGHLLAAVAPAADLADLRPLLRVHDVGDQRDLLQEGFRRPVAQHVGEGLVDEQRPMRLVNEHALQGAFN